MQIPRATPIKHAGRKLIDPRSVVLVVEDEALIRLSAVQIVEDAGYEALQASNADEAIQQLEARSDIRLVFSDVNMPGSMDGLKLANFIRNRWPPIKVIVASGKAIIEEGALPADVPFFLKPYGYHHIAETLARMLETSS